MTETFVYVGREWAGLPAHELANPFTGSGAIERYARWVESLPDLAERLRRLRSDTECGRTALACWCGDYSHTHRPVSCHGQVLAILLADRYPVDLDPNAEW